jgi:hypothetical protein
VRGGRFGNGLPDVDEKLLEGLAVLGLLDRAERRAEHPHAVALEDAGLGELHGEVEAGLATERREQAVRPLALDDPLDDLDGERLDVRDVRDAGVRHDRRGIRVHEDGLDALLAQRATRLRAGVVELRGLADEDRAAADDEHLHRRATASRTSRRKSSKAGSLSRGPGAPSGWYWYVRIGSVRWRRPSTDPSFRFRALTTNPLDSGIVASSTWNSWFWLVTATRPVRVSCTGWLLP